MSIIAKNINHIYSKGLPHQSIGLDDVSFEIKEGEFVGIVGHTGSGKSTLLQHLNGLLKPSSGQIIINGTDITAEKINMIEVRRKTGLVFQYPEYQLFEETVEKDVAFGPKNLGLEEEEIAERVKEAIELVGLDFEAIRDKSPFELSGGQKRRVAIAGVIAMRPEVLILDEPTAGLDPKAHKDVLKMIEGLHGNWNKITVLVSHNMDDIARLSDKVLVMDGGKLILEGTPRAIFSRGDELKELGLSVPASMELTNNLEKKGIAVNANPLTIEETVEAISKIL